MSIRPCPKAVTYTERDGRTVSKGEVSKEVMLDDEYPWGDFKKVLQELRFNGRKGVFIRFGYYVKDHNAPDSEYRWAGQTSAIIQKNKFLRLIEKAKREGIL